MVFNAATVTRAALRSVFPESYASERISVPKTLTLLRLSSGFSPLRADNNGRSQVLLRQKEKWAVAKPPISDCRSVSWQSADGKSAAVSHRPFPAWTRTRYPLHV